MSKSFSDYQQKIFDWVKNGNGNALIQARAGSGKTFTALHAMEYMKGSVISMTFNKKNAIELQQKIAQMGFVHAKGCTFHSEGLNNWKRVHGFVKVEYKKVMNIVERYTMRENEKSARYFIIQMIDLAKQSGFGCEGCPAIEDYNAWIDLALHHDVDLDSDMDLTMAIDIAMHVLIDSNRDFRTIDFNDMIYLPVLNNIKLLQYDWIIIDEAQDTNVVRKLMSKRMMKPNGRFMAIGDEKQAIYGFTGAENDSMNIIKETFNCIELNLPVCYRCGTNIIEQAKSIVPDIEARPEANDGIVRSEEYDVFIKKAKEYGFNRNDGIICRNNAPIVALAFSLIREGIGCRIEGKDIGASLITLANKWKTKDLNVFSDKMNKYFQKEMSNPKISQTKIGILEDKQDTMNILIQRCQSFGTHTVAALVQLIRDMFTDTSDGNVPNVVTLSSIHKAKGMEWTRCFALGNAQFIPSRYAVLPWQQQQETNLKYIAITRAMSEYVDICNVPKPERKQD